MKAKIVLEDGSIYAGESFGGEGETFGEVVFNTSMTGYEEILTDPSYKGQIVVLTYPLIGNYGINLEDNESKTCQIEGLIVREVSKIYSNWRAKTSLQDFLKKNNIIAVEGVDTRAITKKIRTKGVMNGVLTTNIIDDNLIREKVRNLPKLGEIDLVSKVITKGIFNYSEKQNASKEKLKAVVIDFGVKFGILRCLYETGFKTIIVPSQVRFEEIEAIDPDCIVLSNGPGDPAILKIEVELIKKLIGRYPILGICLGHQLLGIAFGGKTYKLKFGHRGANHPVKNLETGAIEITSHNHGYAVDEDSVKNTGLKIWYKDLNDGTVEGFYHENLPVFSVQFHPEASPGPHDSLHIFKKLYNLTKKKLKLKISEQ